MAVLTSIATNVAAGDASTIRIEPRPFYGATVTLEAGVRVFRPLPRTKHVIINPGNATPLNLSVKDVTENRTSHNYYYDHSRPVSAYAPSGAVAPLGAYGFDRGRGGRHGVRGSHRVGGLGVIHPSRSTHVHRGHPGGKRGGHR